MESGVFMSRPAMVLSASARSAAERPRHPLVARVDQPRRAEGFGTRPMEGRKPTMLHQAARLRREPPASEPLATGTHTPGERDRCTAGGATASLSEVVWVAGCAEDRL